MSQMVYTKPNLFQFKYFSPHKINKPAEETIFQLPPLTELPPLNNILKMLMPYIYI